MNQTNTSKRIPTQINEFRGDYAFLSNFYPAPVSYMGQTYANNEAAFQAQKTLSAREQRNRWECTNTSYLSARTISFLIKERILRAAHKDGSFHLYSCIFILLTAHHSLKEDIYSIDSY